MSKIDDLIEELCPEGVTFAKLGQLGVFFRGGSIKKDQLAKSGFPAIHYGEIYTTFGPFTKEVKSFVSKELFDMQPKCQFGDLLITLSDVTPNNVGMATAWVGNDPVALGGDILAFRHNMNPKFVSYLFRTEEFQAQKRLVVTGGTVRHVSASGLSKIRIPVPPLEVQGEIVSILDKFTELEAEQKAELEARKSQYEHTREQLLNFSGDLSAHPMSGLIAELCPEGVTYLEIGHFAKCISGATPSSSNPEYWDSGDIPWMSSGEVNNRVITETEKRISKAGFDSCSTKLVPPNSVVMALAGQGKTRGMVAITRLELCTNQSLCAIICDESVIPDFLYHYLLGQYQVLRNASSGDGGRGGLNLQIVRSFTAPIPPLEVQREIVSILDKLDTLVNDLTFGLPAEISARRKQYEYYRNKLLTFKELESA